ncbi:MAG: hypothetical protein LQ342_007248 [Letrouitia transgressa]|nr:MAG: hypothetical protein LQ342_007248 [Letrouitia transgressa]
MPIPTDLPPDSSTVHSYVHIAHDFLGLDILSPFLPTPARMSSTTSKALDAAKSTTQTAKSSLRTMSEETSTTTSSILHHPYTRLALPFINGGLAGMTATTVIQPIDMIKVRLQLAGEGVKTGPKPTPISVTRDIIRQGKIGDLYTGLSAGLLRQAVYTTARLGFFDTFMTLLKTNAESRGNKVGFQERALAGLSAGGLAAMVGNPADLALIRMQSDGLKPAAERAHYRSVVDALTRISKAEGITALWAGAYPTVVRAMALNFGQLAFFSETKDQLKARTQWSQQTQTLSASAVAGFFASFFSLPFDFVKTRLQKQSRGKDGQLPYKGMADCFRKVARDEGLLRFYRGFGTYYVRIAPHAMVTLIVADWLGFITK